MLRKSEKRYLKRFLNLVDKRESFVDVALEFYRCRRIDCKFYTRRMKRKRTSSTSAN